MVVSTRVGAVDCRPNGGEFNSSGACKVGQLLVKNQAQLEGEG